MRKQLEKQQKKLAVKGIHVDLETLKREYLTQRGILPKDGEAGEIDVVGDEEVGFASQRKKISAFSIESILSGMADFKDEDSMSDTREVNTSYEDGGPRSPSPATSSASSPPCSPRTTAAISNTISAHLRQLQASGSFPHSAENPFPVPIIKTEPESQDEQSALVKDPPPPPANFFFPAMFPSSGGPKDEPEDGSPAGPDLQRPLPLFTRHHLPAFIREKLRAAAEAGAVTTERSQSKGEYLTLMKYIVQDENGN